MARSEPSEFVITWLFGLDARVYSMQNEVATCDDSRNAADAALVVLIGVEQRAAQSWTMNNHGQTVATGEYPSAQLGDMDLLD